MAKVLIIDDEGPILESLEMFLTEKDYDVRTAASAKQGMIAFKDFEPEVVILDIRLPDCTGFEVLARLNRFDPPPKVIMITAFHDMETAISSMKNGAYDYIHKPLDADEIESTTEKAMQAIQAERAVPVLREQTDTVDEDIIIGKSKPILNVFKTIGMLCRNNTTALIQGETGTGKELIARVIHKNCRNSDAPFVTVDCSAMVETLLENELFGHEKGAYTGATQAKAGQIELAGDGTLFLDEIGELSLGLQRKLLGFIERHEYTRVGGQYPQPSRCRILAATHRDLNQMVHSGQFRQDLFYRLNVVTLKIPPLRERAEDIPELTRHFLNIIRRSMKNWRLQLQEGAMEVLMGHPWTGNVRELKNVITAAAVRSRSNVILKEDIEAILTLRRAELQDPMEYTPDLSNIEQRHILRILRKVGWNRTHAARLLGISLPTLRKKIRKFGIKPPKS
ncbi:MAG: sigma-54 dependent transcriptional regulator [Desulfobacteraceae bacterium]|jgi:two-component system response regulator AtoC